MTSRTVLCSTFGIETTELVNVHHIWTKAADVHIWTCYGLFRDNQFAVNSCDLRIEVDFKLNVVSYMPNFWSIESSEKGTRAKKCGGWQHQCHIWVDTNAILGWLLCLKIQTKKPPRWDQAICKWVFNCGKFLRKGVNCLLIFDGPTHQPTSRGIWRWSYKEKLMIGLLLLDTSQDLFEELGILSEPGHL